MIKFELILGMVALLNKCLKLPWASFSCGMIDTCMFSLYVLLPFNFICIYQSHEIKLVDLKYAGDYKSLKYRDKMYNICFSFVL